MNTKRCRIQSGIAITGFDLRSSDAVNAEFRAIACRDG